MLKAIAERHGSPQPDPWHKLREPWANICTQTANLIADVFSLAEQLTAPAPASQLDREIGSLSVRIKTGQTIRAVQTSIFPAVTGMNIAGDSLLAMAAAVVKVETVLPLEVLARHVAECCSTTIWILDRKVDVRTRVARMFLLRYQSAVEERRAAVAIGVMPGGPSEKEVIAIAAAWGWRVVTPVGRKQASVNGETLPSHTQRAKPLLQRVRAAGAYHLYSGSAHGEMYGLLRGLSQPMDAAGELYNIIQFDYFAAWQAVRLANLAAMVAALDYFQLKGRDVAQIEAALTACERALEALKPDVPATESSDDPSGGFHDV
jgi:hypothetical protein